jgi:hypothetical protein
MGRWLVLRYLRVVHEGQAKSMWNLVLILDFLALVSNVESPR